MLPSGRHRPTFVVPCSISLSLQEQLVRGWWFSRSQYSRALGNLVRKEDNQPECLLAKPVDWREKTRFNVFKPSWTCLDTANTPDDFSAPGATARATNRTLYSITSVTSQRISTCQKGKLLSHPGCVRHVLTQTVKDVLVPYSVLRPYRWPVIMMTPWTGFGHQNKGDYLHPWEQDFEGETSIPAL